MESSRANLISDLAATVRHVPSKFVRPIGERPNLEEVHLSHSSTIPLIDISALHGPNRSQIIQQIGHACQNFGFFQVVNHGVEEEVVEKMMKVSREFFELPHRERAKWYSEDPLKTTRLSTSFNVKTEKVGNWRDYLRLHCHPLQNYIKEWPTNPASFRCHVADYCTQMRALSLLLLRAISESLGLDADYINRVPGQHGQHMAINYYPPCRPR